MCLFKAFGWQIVSLPVSWHLLQYRNVYKLPRFVRGNPIYSGPLFRFTPAPFFGLLRPLFRFTPAPFSVYSGPLFDLLRTPFFNPQQKHTLEKFTPGKSGFTPGHFRVYSGLFSGTFSGLLRDMFGFTPGHFRVYSGTFSDLLQDIPKAQPGDHTYTEHQPLPSHFLSSETAPKLSFS